MTKRKRPCFPVPGQTPPVERAYFFDAGLRFACRRCGVCCTGASGTIYVAKDEIAPVAAALFVSEAELIERYCYPFRDSFSLRERKDGSCCLYDGGCTVYPVRPRQCSTWPFWFDVMRSEKRWQNAAKNCPGIGQGRLHTREEILRCIAQSYPAPRKGMKGWKTCPTD